ncbi:MAG: deaminase [Candidatus Nanohaloarchaea archaeon]|nr:deaminase [Candidatus Nanohaloarchaea archaeon]
MSPSPDLPFEPDDGSIDYVSPDNEYMQAAKDVAREESIDSHPAGAVIVKHDSILGSGANGSDYHDNNECVRERLKEQGEIASGEGYERCEGCHPKNHAEPTAIQDAHDQGNDDLDDADLYLWGHWWACEWCWDEMLDEGIDQLYLHEDSKELFNKDSDDYVFADGPEIKASI